MKPVATSTDKPTPTLHMILARSAPPRPADQRGVALVVALMMVLITSILGMTVMRVGALEVRAIASEEADRTVFHAAETAALATYGSLEPGTLPIAGVTQVPVTSTDERIDVTVSAHHEGLVPVVNSSLRLFARNAYAIESVATADGIGSRRGVVVGAAQIVPRAP